MVNKMQYKYQGFTLIELLVAIAIVGILAAIAVPTYSSYLLKSNRTTAQGFLADLAQRQQQYLLDARSYATNLSGLSMAVPNSVSKYYTIQEPFQIGTTPNSFTVSAIPIGIQIDEPCGALSIDNLGSKLPSNCW